MSVRMGIFHVAVVVFKTANDCAIFSLFLKVITVGKTGIMPSQVHQQGVDRVNYTLFYGLIDFYMSLETVGAIQSKVWCSPPTLDLRRQLTCCH
jgi:energy-converting hydrogenase Eha subunit H